MILLEYERKYCTYTLVLLYMYSTVLFKCFTSLTALRVTFVPVSFLGGTWWLPSGSMNVWRRERCWRSDTSCLTSCLWSEVKSEKGKKRRDVKLFSDELSMQEKLLVKWIHGLGICSTATKGYFCDFSYTVVDIG